MYRSLLGATLLFIVSGCGSDTEAPDVPTGTFRLTGETVNGTVTPASQLDGAVELTATEIALGIAAPSPSGALGAFTVSADGRALVITGGDTIGFSTSNGGRELTLTPTAGRTLTFTSSSPSPTDTVQVRGTVTMASGAPALSTPRAALIFYSRSEPFVNDPRDDQALNFSGDTATFDVSRTDAARGTDRIPFGGSAGLSIAIVVVYDDRDDNGELGELDVCSPTTVDCVRAVSPVVVGYRNGDSTQLAASQYAYLRPGWSNAVVVPDRRNGGKLGPVSASPQNAYQHAITVGGDAGQVNVPRFDLTLP